MKHFCLPSDFKHATIDSYFDINNIFEDSKICETYGQMAPDTVFGSLRINSALPVVDMDILEKYICYSRDKGIEFNYLCNVTCMENNELTKDGFEKIKEFFKMLREIGVSSITLALPSLMEIAAYVIPEVKIKASTVCQINSPLKAVFYEELGIKRIVLDEDIYRNFGVLRNIRKAYKGELEIILNSFCSNDCPYKMFHYNSFSHSHTAKELYSYYSKRCKIEHIGAESFMKLNWIRPEDLHYYHEMGIEHFKIQGRTNVCSGDPAKAVSSYIEGRYDGDFVRLLELFSPLRPLAIAEVKVDNRKLDGFLDRFVKLSGSCSKLCNECGYCKGYGDAAVSETDRAVMDLMKSMSGIVKDEFPCIMEK